MRLIVLLTPLAMAACATPPPQIAPAGATQTVATPFDIPMDPGAISCQSLSNPTALSSATEWAMGRARAGVLSGQSATVPDASSLSAMLALYCQENPQGTVNAAVTHFGL